ncbi:MAG TPA: hypothetical protein VME67_23925 [Mycobacterium sp.]|nr:hypothetical protein [Mycobacterium sp.]HTX97607.1 hypothetical protein [Mycobacterium sp.]
MAAAVERDAVRLAARPTYTPNGVLINEFRDSRGLIGREHPTITNHHHVFRAIHAASHGVETGHLDGGLAHSAHRCEG